MTLDTSNSRESRDNPTIDTAKAEDFLATARARWKLAAEAEQRNRDEALDDLKFAAGEQWPDQIRTERQLDNRPCLTINRLPQFIRQVTNEQRQNRPSVQVNPVSGGADEETAEVLQGLIRHIEVSSHADSAYDTAFESAAKAGFGYFRVVTDYCDPEGFDQELRIKRIRNPFSVYFDPYCQEPDYSDADFAFIVEDIPREQFVRDHPKSEIASLADFASIGDTPSGWITADSVRVAEYFYIEHDTKKIAKLADGRTVDADKVPKGAKVLKTRTADVRRVKWCLINALEVLDERDIPGEYITIIPVLGEEVDIDGERRLMGMVRSAKDPQRMYNYWATAETETIALAPRAPFIGAEGQFEGFEGQWKSANTRNHAYLQYKPKSVNGQLAPAPERNTYEPPVAAITQARLAAADDLKATTGIYDAALGANGNETSGRAILARKSEGDTANFHLTDNLTRSIRHLGRILIGMIPGIYDAPRVARIIGEDGTAKTVQVNQHFQDEQTGIAKIFDLTTGKYDVTVTSGPSYQSKRQEAVESMLELTKAYPPLAQIAGDLLVKNMDWPGADEIASRLQKMLPPQLQDGNNPQQQLQQQQAAMQQLTAQHSALVQRIHELTDVIQSKKLELDSKERIALLNAQVALIGTEAKIRAQDAATMLQGEMTSIKQRLEMMTEATGIDAEQSHEAALQASQQAHEAALQQAEQQHAAQLAQQQQQHQAGMQQQSQQAALEQQKQAATLAQQQPQNPQQ